MEQEQTDIITFNGSVGLLSDQVADEMIKTYFEHFSYVSLAHLQLSSNVKMPHELLIEYGQKKENQIISYPNAYDYLPNSFKVFFVNGLAVTSDSLTIIQQKSNLIVLLDDRELPENIAESITVAFGHWANGRSSKKIVI